MVFLNRFLKEKHSNFFSSVRPKHFIGKPPFLNRLAFNWFQTKTTRMQKTTPSFLLPLLLLSAVSLSRAVELTSLVTCPTWCRKCDCCSVLDPASLTRLQLTTSTSEEAGCQARVEEPCGCGQLEQDAAFYVDHSDDCLTGIPDDLTRYQRLVRLVLSRNQIQNVTFLPSVATLVELDLSHNVIESLPGHLLEEAGLLRHLDLSFNRIASIAPGFFHEGLTGLKVVDLSHNQLVRAEAWPMMLGPFCRFDLSHNLITRFANTNNWTLDSAAEGTLGPGMMNLTHNQFRQWFLDDLSMYGFSSVWSLFRLVRWGFDLRENPWNCDCSLRGVLTAFQLLARFSPRDYFNLKCHSPPELANRTVLSLSIFELPWC